MHALKGTPAYCTLCPLKHRATVLGAVPPQATRARAVPELCPCCAHAPRLPRQPARGVEHMHAAAHATRFQHQSPRRQRML